MKRILILAALATLARGQDEAEKKAMARQQAMVQQELEARRQEQQRAERVAQVFTIKNGGISQIAQALRTSGATVYEDQRLKTIVVSAPRSLMANFKQIVEQLDVPADPPKNVEVITYILEASGQADRAGTVPGALTPVTKQLTDLFGYTTYRVLDTALVRSREGEVVMTVGNVMFGNQGKAYTLEFRPYLLASAKGRAIRMESFNFGGPIGARVRADFEIGEGQKVVVGKAGLEGPDRALVLVVTGRVID